MSKIKLFLEQYKTIIIGAVVLVAIGVYFVTQDKKTEVGGQTVSEPLALAQTEEGTEKKEGESGEQTGDITIFVDVKGAIGQPGLYPAKEGERVQDLVIRAGDFTAEAALDQINLAQKITDEMVIYIPRIGEEVVSELMSADGGGQSTSTQKEGGQVNLNTADATELQTLSGIGVAKAQAIIDFREENGPFKEIEELKKISGIGEKTFEKLAEGITVR